MDVFSLLKFWRNAGVGHPIDASDDEGSFFDLVFTNNEDSPQVNIITSGFHYDQFSKMDGADADLKSNHNYLSPHTVFKTPLDSSNTKTPRSPFRVLMLGFQNTKSKSGKKEMKCEIEEVTISSLLKRDHDQVPSKRFSKEVVHRYLNLIKPLVFRRSNQHSPRKEEKPSVFKHLRKSRSTSVVKPIPSPSATRNDSEDGIQSAILHCKKSYNSPSQGCINVLSRSGSAPSQGNRISIDDEKRSSI